MSARHLRPRAGGDPARAPLPDEANPSPGPSVGGDFPDEPDTSHSGDVPDRPDLDAFAARLGIDALDDSDTDVPARPGSGDVQRRASRAMSAALRATASVSRAAANRLHGLSDRLDARTRDRS